MDSVVPPLYNDNYTTLLEPIVLRRPVPVGQSTVPVSDKNEKPSQAESVRVNDTDASTSCADSVLVEDWDNDDTKCVTQNTNIVDHVSSKTCGDVLNANSKNRSFKKVKP